MAPTKSPNFHSSFVNSSKVARNKQHHHHHHRVARPWQDIAVSTSLRHLERSCARFHAELRPTLCCWRSSSIVRSQVRLGRPGGRRQSTGRRLMAARRAREWSWDRPARAMWQQTTWQHNRTLSCQRLRKVAMRLALFCPIWQRWYYLDSGCTIDLL